ncbi:Broad specificity phosphatase PhoE [Geosmithia morbida]|uniref:Broad specificity phosphatase PhoE n=1 Tax=Geosmithia morbida TaxID=1094350 RepID=A0A9P5D6E2_9HYPO|nr:Broad specificity phosphatase PhoE [Geosmithia morbida]KAF4125521.1 Broad specificity phosphatase PhoE [Geosmithia morbida]
MKASVLYTALGLLPLVLCRNVWREARGKSIEYTSVEGYFLQDDKTTSTDGFDYADVNFGLIDRKYPTDNYLSRNDCDSQWERFDRWVKYLNWNPRNRGDVQYKVIFMGRHGNGWHNSAETFYGTPAWNCYWAEQTGNGTAYWKDAALTSAGIDEALKANAYFKDRYATQNMPHFESYYVSPLQRCTTTANLTFGDIDLPRQHPFVPTVKELFREGMTPHTCNWRSNKTFIGENFPRYEFEKGFAEHDELWDATKSETGDAQDVRAKAVLDDMFRNDSNTWISVTAHSGMISRLLKALNHREFRLSTGQIIPVLVKAEAIDLQPQPTYQAHEPYSTCTAPPITSIAERGCVCPTPTTTALPS